MKKFIKQALRALLGIILLLGITGTVFAADVGTGEDALITKSYLDQVFYPKITAYIDSKIAGNSTTTSSPTQTISPASPDSSVFKLLSFKKGDIVICAEGAELVLRSGSAAIVATSRGGLSNLTKGTDLSNGAAMPLNNHLLVPRGDGRGFAVTADALVLIKGAYSVK